MIFHTTQMDGQAAGPWKAIQAAAAKHHRAIVEVREYDPDAEVSDQQRKYWFAVPVEHYAEWTGYDKRSAERELKLKFADQWFVKIHKGARVLLSIRDISIKDMNDIIEAVCVGLQEYGVKCELPDPQWREHEAQAAHHAVTGE